MNRFFRFAMMLAVVLCFAGTVRAQLSVQPLPYQQGFEDASAVQSDGWTQRVASFDVANSWVNVRTCADIGSPIISAHGGGQFMYCPRVDSSRINTVYLYSPWFEMPAGVDTVTVSFWYANPVNGYNTAFDTLMSGYVTSPDQLYSHFLFVSDVHTYSAGGHNGWTRYTGKVVRSVVSEEDSSNNLFRIVFLSKNKLGLGVMIDDFQIYVSPTSLSSTVMALPYHEDFEGCTSLNETDWDINRGSSVNPWTLHTGARAVVTSAHSGVNNLYLFNRSRGNGLAAAISPWIQLPENPAPGDSVEVSFWYANPDWDGDTDRASFGIEFLRPGTGFNYGMRILWSDDPVREWTNFTYRFAASQYAGCLMNFQAYGAANYGNGIVVDDISISLIRTIATSVYPPNSGVIAGVNDNVTAYDVITATPNAGYDFASWSDGVTTASRTVGNESNFTALFAPTAESLGRDTVTVTITDTICASDYTVYVVSSHSTLGIVSGTGTFPAGTQYSIGALANEGARFVSWSDGITANPRTIIVESDSVFTALFESIVPECQAITESDLPYTEDFEGYTETTKDAKTGIEPTCWTLAHKDVSMNDSYKPMIYYSSAYATSGNYSLILNKRCIYAMPAYEGNVNTLQLSMSVKQPSAYYNLIVGVMSDTNDATTFVPVTVVNNTSTGFENVVVNFSSYTGNGHYIAFRNANSSTTSNVNFGINYIDDIVLDISTAEPEATCGIATTDLPYSENFDGYTTSTTAKTGVEPTCWTLAHKDVSMNDSYKPMIYCSSAYATSGNYSLILNKRGIYAMPAFDGNVNTLQLSMSVKQPSANYNLIVGVMSDTTNASTFVPVTVVNNSSTGFENVVVNFSSYTGNGHYIAFRNANSSTTSNVNFGINYIDDIVLDISTAEPEATCGIATTDLPYSENFDGYTTSTTAKTGVEPTCWTLAHKDVSMNDSYKPMIYCSSAYATSGSYSLILNKRGIYAMPAFEGNVNTLQLSMSVKQPSANYNLIVGVMSDTTNASTFVPVTVVNNSSTGFENVVVNFSSYTGNGHYIAFRNANSSTTSNVNFGINYIDDIVLDISTAEPESTCGIATTDLPYSENFDGYTTSTIAKTGVEPTCWTLAYKDVSMNDSYKPMIYYSSAYATSGNYSLILNKRGIYAMPAFEGNVNTLQLSMSVKQPSTNYNLIVGVMSDTNDATTFVPVTVVNNSSTGFENVLVNFSSYTGNGHYIAFRNANSSTTSNVNFGINYIDDIVLDISTAEPESTCGIATTDLPYSENFDGYTTSTIAKTGVEPTCWTLAHKDVSMGDSYRPMIYCSSAYATSGNYSLILNKRGIYAMPAFEGNVNALQLSMSVKQPSTNYNLIVGVMSDTNDATTFVPVTVVNNTSTGFENVVVNFSSYTGNGHYIAFRNANSSTTSNVNFGINYIDDITLSLRSASMAPDALDSDDLSADVNPGELAISEGQSEINLYPNPTSGKVTIDGAEVLKVEVYDYCGRRVAEFEGANDIDISSLATGIYSLRITTDEKVAIKKVVKK